MVDPKILSNFIDESGLKYKKGSSSYIFDCPICNKKDKLYIRRSDGLFICFYCKNNEKFYGRPEFALSKLLNLPLEDIRAKLYGSRLVEYKELISIKWLNHPFDDWMYEDIQDESEDNNIGKEFPPDFIPIEEIYCTDVPILKDAISYLNSRGVSPILAVKYGLRYNPSSRRIIFPVVVDGKLLGHQARMIDPSEIVDVNAGKTIRLPKILTSSGLSASKVVMFQDRLKDSRHAIITEGPFDAIKCDLLGGNIATMGKNISKEKMHNILSYGAKRVYLGLDRDAANEVKQCIQIIKEYDNSIEVFRLLPPEHREDLGDCDQLEVRDQFRIAEPINNTNIFIHFRSS